MSCVGPWCSLWSPPSSCISQCLQSEWCHLLMSSLWLQSASLLQQSAVGRAVLHTVPYEVRGDPPDTLLTHKTLCSVLPSAQVYSIFYSCLFLKRVSWAKEMALSGKGLPWKQETQVWAPSTHIRSYMWWHVPSGQGAGDAETGGSLRLTAWPALLNQQAIMRCQRPCLSRKEEVNRERHQKLTSDLHVHEHPCMNTQKHIHIPYTYFK